MQARFHLAFHVLDLEQARLFYSQTLGCTEGRSTATWVDFDFYGHQLSLHLGQPFATTNTGLVDQHSVPMPHFGLILDMPEWKLLAQRLTALKIEFVLPPSIRFAGQAGEQATMFLLDPSGNAIEIKGFATEQGIYAK